MRLFTATIATETNTFSPLPTSLDAYKETVFFRPGEHPDDAPRMCTAPLFVARRRAKAEDFTLIEGSCFAASPAGTTNRADYEFMRDEILDQLQRSATARRRAARPARRHGGAWLRRRRRRRHRTRPRHRRTEMRDRRRTRPALPSHASSACRLADIVILYKEFPHTDVVERAEDLLTLVLRTIRERDPTR